MNARTRVLNLAVVALFLAVSSGCVVVKNNPKPHNGNITLLWSFGGSKCFQVQGVTRVHIVMPGQTLAQSGIYPCTANNTDGVTLLNFAPGTYPYTITGENDAGAQFYTGSGSVTVVDGDVQQAIDLTAATGAPAYAYITWSFPTVGSNPNPTCAQAGITNVVVSIDNGQGQAFTCGTGEAASGASGVLVTTVGGTHSIDVSASDDAGFYYFHAAGTLPPLVAGASVAQTVSLQWNAGSLPVRWTFSSGGVTRTCAYVGATQVRIDLKDSHGNWVYDANTGTMVDCSTNGLQGTTFLYLYPDTYTVYVQAVGSGAILYRSNQTTPPTAVVTAGQFPAVSTATPEIVLQ